MEQMDDDESFLEELMMSLRRGMPPADLSQLYPMSPMCGGGSVMLSDLLVGGDVGSMRESSSPSFRPPVPLPPSSSLPPVLPGETSFRFDCLGEICNPYKNGAGVRADTAAQLTPMESNREVAAAAAAADEEERCGVGGARRGGAPGGELRPMLVLDGVGGAAARSESETTTKATSVQPRSFRPHPGGPSSKNLIAERRRRKRLNDRLSMLRSVVPRISKMDRTSILGDTIGYVKELMDRIKTLHEEAAGGSSSPENLATLNTLKPPASSSGGGMHPRNSTRFDVERRENGSTRIEMACAAIPGLLPTTLSALEELGVEIEQCVVSCFHDFAMQATCLQDEEKREMVSGEVIKQTLFKSAGYGGCLL